ncbi:MAG: glycosyltransferase family 2 protein [Paludibacteraceae bacterium]|nr:glycosyltransferase family 2 protein [Paludibacteraceae bacterium]
MSRCLDSIPQREDIEIIVIDDNSDADKRPAVTRSDVRLIYIDAEHTKGAGRARNYGLKEAKGTWIVFADCDDFFVQGFLSVLDKYKDSEVCVVYHPADAADTQTLEPIPQLLRQHNGYFEKYDGSKESENFIRFRLHSPWWKMVRRDFIVKHKIQFEEVLKGNDVFFTFQVGYYARKIAVEQSKIYVYTYNLQGITNGKKNKSIYLHAIQNIKKSNEFYKFIGHPEWRRKTLSLWLKIIKQSGVLIFFQTLFAYAGMIPDIRRDKMKYVDAIRTQKVEQ